MLKVSFMLLEKWAKLVYYRMLVWVECLDLVEIDEVEEKASMVSEVGVSSHLAKARTSHVLLVVNFP